ncbi:MAG: hypothetical protein LUE27_00070 [Clostridia bacterium]|nr:hypothetical protein [Clostridia bacterium]
MPKFVGLSKKLKLAWLNRTVELILSETQECDLKKELNEYLKFEIGSAINIRKTREILMRVWFYENEYTKKIRTPAIELIKKYPEYAVGIHWCMILAAYPVFMDLCRIIGKMSEFQDEIFLSNLKKKIFDEWGERSTLLYSTSNVITTLKALDALTSDKPGRFQIKKHIVKNSDVAIFMAYTVMCVAGRRDYSLQEINAFECLFPFEYQVEKAALLQDKRLTATNNWEIGLRFSPTK